MPPICEAVCLLSCDPPRIVQAILEARGRLLQDMHLGPYIVEVPVQIDLNTNYHTGDLTFHRPSGLSPYPLRERILEIEGVQEVRNSHSTLMAVIVAQMELTEAQLRTQEAQRRVV